MHLLTSLAIDNVFMIVPFAQRINFQNVRKRKNCFADLFERANERECKRKRGYVIVRLCALNNFKIHINNNSRITWWNFNWSVGCRRQIIANKYQDGFLLPNAQHFFSLQLNYITKHRQYVSSVLVCVNASHVLYKPISLLHFYHSLSLSYHLLPIHWRISAHTTTKTCKTSIDLFGNLTETKNFFIEFEV